MRGIDLKTLHGQRHLVAISVSKLFQGLLYAETCLTGQRMNQAQKDSEVLATRLTYCTQAC